MATMCHLYILFLLCSIYSAFQKQNKIFGRIRIRVISCFCELNIRYHPMNRSRISYLMDEDMKKSFVQNYEQKSYSCFGSIKNSRF